MLRRTGIGAKQSKTVQNRSLDDGSSNLVLHEEHEPRDVGKEVSPQTGSERGDLVMPSKLTGMLASGKAIIATAQEGTELAAVVRKCGLVVPPEQPDEFSDAILRLARDPQIRKTLGRNGRGLAERELSKDVVSGRFLENIRHCVDESEKYANQGTKPL